MKNTFYISANGNDANEGVSEASAWRTIGRINDALINPGDEIRFHCGDRFAGELKIRFSGTIELPIIISSFGKGEKPVLTGAVAVKDWEQDSEGRFFVDFQRKAKSLFVNNNRFDLARYPANGFFNIEEGDKVSLVDSRNLSVDFDLAGATARIRTVNWQYETIQVASHKDGRIFFDGKLMYQCNQRYGYFLDNKPEFLKKTGQWFCEQESKKLWLLPLNEKNLNEEKVEATVFSNGIKLENNVSNISIQGLHFEKYDNAAILGLPGSTNITIADCKINDINVYGICLDVNSSHYTIQNNQIEDIGGRGISTIESSFNLICDNKISRIGLFPGYGFDGVNNGIGIAVLKTEVKFEISKSTLKQLHSKNIPETVLLQIGKLVELPYPDEKFVIEALETILGKELAEKYIPEVIPLVKAEVKAQKLESTQNRVVRNRVEKCGYAGIRVDGNNSIAEYNLITDSLLHMNDGGALYCWAQNEDYTHNNIFRSNIIINALGNCEATANDLAYAYGIYTDNKCHHITIENNIVMGTVGGILINDEAHHQVIRGNTLYDNQYGLVFSEYFMPGSLSGCEAIGNILFSKRRNQRALFVESRIRENFRPGLLDKNLYANPYYPFPILELTYKDDMRIFKEFTLQSWQKHYGNDEHSETIATANHDVGGQYSEILINDSFENKILEIPGEVGYTDLNGNSIQGLIELTPFSSLVILQK